LSENKSFVFIAGDSSLLDYSGRHSSPSGGGAK
jgi:hypothetical protein